MLGDLRPTRLPISGGYVIADGRVDLGFAGGHNTPPQNICFGIL